MSKTILLIDNVNPVLCYLLVSIKAALSPCSCCWVIGVPVEGDPRSQGAGSVKVLLAAGFCVCEIASQVDRINVHTLGIWSSAQPLLDALPNGSANEDFTLS